MVIWTFFLFWYMEFVPKVYSHLSFTAYMARIVDEVIEIELGPV
jgi:hypothetical protein